MSQIWPNADDFIPAFGASPTLYQRATPWDDTEAQTGFDLSATPGTLHDGRRVGTSIYASIAGFDANGPAVADVSIMVARHGLFVDGEADYTPAVVSTGLLSYEDFRACGIAARVRIGAAVTPTDPQDYYQRIVSGLLFLQVRNPTSEKLVLLHCVSGTITTLASIDISTIDAPNGAFASGQDRYLPLRMRMVTENVGSNVEVTCYRYSLQPTGGQTGGPTYVEVDVFGTVQIPFDGIVQFSGGHGFVQSTSRTTPSGTQAAVCCRRFFVRETVGGTLTTTFEDLFLRAVPRLCDLVTDSHGPDGRSLMSAWIGDFATWELFPTIAGTISRHSPLRIGEQPIAPFAANTATVGWFASQNPEQTSNQGAKIRVTIPDTGSSNVREVGLFLRGSVVATGGGTVDMRSESFNGFPFNSGRSGYLLLAIEDPVDGRRLELRRYAIQSGVPDQSTVLATVVPATLAADDEIDLELEVVTVATGWTELTAKYNGSLLNWAPAAGFFNVAGVIQDDTSLKVVQGSLIGFYGRIGGTDWIADGQVRVDNWERLDVEAPGSGGGSGGGGGTGGSGGSGGDPGPPPNVQSIVIPSEGWAVTGTLKVPTSWPIDETVRRDPTRHVMESGHEHLHARQITARRNWRFITRGATPSQQELLEEFWRDHKGPEIPFYFFHPRTNERLMVRFKGSTLFHRVTHAAEGVSKSEDLAFDLEEVLPPTLASGEPGIDPPRPPGPTPDAGGGTPTIPGGGGGETLQFNYSLRTATELDLGDANQSLAPDGVDLDFGDADHGRGE